MSDPSTLSERRRFKRFKVKNRAYTLNSAKPGLILDICLGGLSFRYIDRKDWPEETNTLDIVVGEDEEFRLDDIPYRVISENETVSDIAYEKMTVKRRGVEFCDLSQDQQFKLQQLIDSNSVPIN